ncbi:MAG: polyprenyl synthetase family protein [Anaerolineae bacterium]|jgi:geranylgeranyl pyrophosphate synthase|nr:polyprenyl synthetase family protein [Anaerolineae bacterium]
MNARKAANELQYRTLLHNDLEATKALLLSSCHVIPVPVRGPVEALINGGGKRLRPAFLLLVARLFAADEERALLAAAAVEMLHTATLIHDDIIDNAAVRRGIMTVNARWPATAAVLAGDIVFAQAAKLIAQTREPVIVERFAVALEVICLGELGQMFGSAGTIPTLQAYLDRIFAKTASLFALCAEIGPLLAQYPDEVVAEARRFGRLLGEAFQITDDVLDLRGDSNETGKPVGVDLRQGLATLPVLLYRAGYPDDHRIEAILTRSADEHTIESFIQDLRCSAAVDQAMGYADARAEEALSLLRKHPDTPHRCALEELVHFAVDRAY